MSSETEKPVSRTMDRRKFMILFGGTAAVVGGAVLLKLAEQGGGEESPFETQPVLDLDFSTKADGEPLDPRVWNLVDSAREPVYNNEAQAYTPRPQNIRVENNMLVIQAHKEQYNGQEYTSGRINTRGKLDMLYGKVEIEAQLPSGIGTWPAFWLRTSDTPYTDGASEEERAQPNFYRLNGEMDFMEAQGARPGKIFANAHTKLTADAADSRNQGEIDVPTSSTTFHRYGLEWTPSALVFLLDGQEYHRVDKQSDQPEAWPFNHHFNLVINLAMGGNWAMSLKERLNLPFENGIDDSMADNWKLLIKSIRYWPLKA